MKKNYITPSLTIVEAEIESMICMSVEPGTETNTQYSNRNNFFLDEDELEKLLDEK